MELNPMFWVMIDGIQIQKFMSNVTIKMFRVTSTITPTWNCDWICVQRSPHRKVARRSKKKFCNFLTFLSLARNKSTRAFLSLPLVNCCACWEPLGFEPFQLHSWHELHAPQTGIAPAARGCTLLIPQCSFSFICSIWKEARAHS